MKRRWLFLATVSLVAFSSCSKDDDEKLPPPIDIPTEVSSVTLTPSDTTIYSYLNETLPASIAIKVVPDDADNKTITWSSDNKEYVTVNDNGALTLVKPIDKDITVTITATSANEKTGTCKITLLAMVDKAYGVIDVTKDLGFFILDRNIGATEKFNGDYTTANVNSKGNYYQFGKNASVAANGATSANKEFDKTWNAEGSKFVDWTVAENTPCPKGWRIPNQAEVKKIADATFFDMDFVDEGLQSQEEYDAAKALYDKLLIARNGVWAEKDEQQSDGTKVKKLMNYLPKAGYFWSSTINPDVTTDGFKTVFSLSDNYFVTIDKKTPVTYAMPIRCIKDAPQANVQ